MKLLLILIVTVLNCYNAVAQKLKITNLSGDFYVYTTYKEIDGKPFPSNAMYLVTNKGVVLIDTPWDETQFQPLLDSIQKRHHQKPVLCIATHYHDDRTAGLEYFRSKGIKTYSSKLTQELCQIHQEKQAEFHFEKDTIFEVGSYKFQTYYPGEGHTKDNIVIWFPEQKILYGGCLVKSTESENLGNIADANLDKWSQSIRNLDQNFPDPKYVIPGHFKCDSDNISLMHTVKLLRQNYKATHKP